ncbi:hypothetical protein LO772_10890 [Yinghuangia sp. ASG 101]|uniref:hypothetical protein n=1 Tax=Yinghuangia sp. ASG 101 TaxID=2896848 RepID=UPI001E36E587|nr:hypothetical protein [Yinghuangia sp. ASG 101]UGQ14057.1 hypothetical protein LO772_10890 [Yinghuangia sp. ASG 101]
MTTDERMHDFFSRIIPDHEPEMPDLAPVARREGGRLRRRSRLRACVAATAVAAVLGGAATAAVELGSGDTDGSSAAAERETRLFTAVRDALPPNTVSVRALPESGFPSVRVVSADGAVTVFTVIGPRTALPDESYACGTAATPCDWRPLPDGSRAASGHLAEPDGTERSWLDIMTPEHRHVTLLATNAQEGSGHTPGAPLTSEQLVQLASDAKVMAALQGLATTQLARDEEDRERLRGDAECRYVLDLGTGTLVCPPGTPIPS